MAAVAPAPAAPAAAPAGPPKKKRKLALLAVCVVFSAAGAAAPMLFDVRALFAKSKGEKKANDHGKTAIVPFGDLTVNLAEDRMQRYLRIKLAVLVDAEQEKEMTELLTKSKAAVKSKLISHLAGKTLKDVSGSVGVNRLQREIRERFDDVLYPDGDSHIRGVLFEEYVVQ